MLDSESIGYMTAPTDADVLVEERDDDAAQQAVDGTGSLLWGYQHDGRLYGVNVAKNDLALKIDSDSLLSIAFSLIRTTRSEVLYISPDGGKGNDRYDELLDGVNDGRIEIIDELRNWDQERSRFVLWLRYNELEYRLNPRFDYLREA